GPPLPGIPTPEPLPTLAPGTTLPAERKGAAIRPTPQPEPIPVNVPTPASEQETPPPIKASPSTRSSARPSATPLPAALPTAFTQTNVFIYGSAPQNNYAQPQAPPQIFYAQVGPSVLRAGDALTISAITSTNVTRLTFGASALLASTSISSIGPGKWQATFTFNTGGLTQSSGNIQMTLNAYNSSGAVATIPIPISLVNQ
ncbi:MAG: hypothetical protein ABI182_03905, partial [Candidatus Baltobacteraceae bacterium]